MASDCITWDWILTVAVTLLAIAITWLDRDVKPRKPVIQILIALLFLIYIANYLFIAYFVDIFEQQAAGIAVSVLIVLAAYVIAYRVNFAFIGVLLVGILISRGWTPWASITISLFVAGLVTALVVYSEVENMGHLLANSLALAASITVGAIGIFANARDMNAPEECASRHINMIIVCDKHCGSILTDEELDGAYWAVVIAVAALGVTRTLLIYFTRVANVPSANTDSEKQKQKRLGICWHCCMCCTPQTAGFRGMKRAQEAAVEADRFENADIPAEEAPAPAAAAADAERELEEVVAQG